MQTFPCDKLDMQCFLGQCYLHPGRTELPLSWCFRTVWTEGCLCSTRITKYKSEHCIDETTWETHSYTLKWILNKGMCKKEYTGCLRRKGPNFGRVFLRSNYNDITQNTYIQSSMVTEILVREV